MTDESAFSDRRKFVRVITHARQGQLEPLEKLTLQWESGEEVPIYDISYGGVACEAPKKEICHTTDIKAFVIHFPSSSREKFIAEVVWENPPYIGLSFETLSVNARRELNHFLDNKILGASLRLIDKQFYSKNMTCQYWYQGDFGVNLYLWESAGQITKGEVEFDNSIVSVNKDSIEWSRSLETVNDLDLKKDLIVKKAVDILSQMAVKEAPVQEFLRQVLKNK